MNKKDVGTAISVRTAATNVLDLERVEVDGWNAPAYPHPEVTRPRRVTGAALLSPFDPVVWERDRAEHLFGFRNRTEIYVLEPQRVYGYYVLPFLLDCELVGRVDLKAHRSSGVLEVKSAHLEDGADAGRVAVALAGELRTMSDWLALGEVAVGDGGDLAAALRRAV